MVIAGIIRPPPDIRAVVDRTAEYVAKNGRAFEARILKSEKGRTPKFAFLQPSSPFHAYYEDRIRVYEDGFEEETEGKNDDEDHKAETSATQDKDLEQPLARKEKQQQASATDPIAKAVLLHRSKMNKFKEEESKEDIDGTTRASTKGLSTPHDQALVSIIAPSDLSTAQIEIIQLVAQYSALDGKGGSFLHQLSVREWSNNDFAFCQPRHPNFAFFSAMVDAYSGIVRKWSSGNGTLGENGTAVSQALDEAAHRAEHDRAISHSADEDGGPGIDWHDFVVVETIDFPVDEVVELSMLPPPSPTSGENERYTYRTTGGEGETIRVVPSYTPRVVVPAKMRDTRAIDPITGKSVSVADMPEHMRIQLLDPKWAKDKKKFQEKQKESNLVGGDAVAANITRLGDPGAMTKSSSGGKSSSFGETKTDDPGSRMNRNGDQPNASGSGTNSAIRRERDAAAVEPGSKRMRIADEGAIPSTYATNHAGGVSADHSSLSVAQGVGEESEFTTVVDTSKTNMLSEEQFQASLAKPEVTIQIRIPNDPSQIAWNFYGQILSMKVHVMTKIKDVKSELSRRHLHGMPPNKIQLRDTIIGFLKDSSTLASLNMGPTATVEMIPKTRGGRK